MSIDKWLLMIVLFIYMDDDVLINSGVVIHGHAGWGWVVLKKHYSYWRKCQPSWLQTAISKRHCAIYSWSLECQCKPNSWCALSCLLMSYFSFSFLLTYLACIWLVNWFLTLSNWQIFQPEDPTLYAWQGAAIFARQEQDAGRYHNYVVTRAEYLEHGHAVCSRKFVY